MRGTAGPARSRNHEREAPEGVNTKPPRRDRLRKIGDARSLDENPWMQKKASGPSWALALLSPGSVAANPGRTCRDPNRCGGLGTSAASVPSWLDLFRLGGCDRHDAARQNRVSPARFVIALRTQPCRRVCVPEMVRRPLTTRPQARRPAPTG